MCDFRNGGEEDCRRILERRSAQTALLFSALYWRPRLHEGSAESSTAGAFEASQRRVDRDETEAGAAFLEGKTAEQLVSGLFGVQWIHLHNFRLYAGKSNDFMAALRVSRDAGAPALGSFL